MKLLRYLRLVWSIWSTPNFDWTPQEKIDFIRGEVRHEIREALLSFQEAEKTSAALNACLARIDRIREREAEFIREQRQRQASEKRAELIGWSVVLLIFLLLGCGLYAIVRKFLM